MYAHIPCEISTRMLSLLFIIGMLSNKNGIGTYIYFSLAIERFWALYSSPEIHS